MSQLQPIRRVGGRPIPLRGNDIDTDRVIPARFMKAITFDGLGQYAFYDVRFDSEGRPTGHVMDDPRFQAKGPRVALVNKNFGCGSSREHAPQAIQRWGIQAIVGESFAEIFFGNSVMIGLLCVTASPADLKEIYGRIAADPQITMVVDLEAGTCSIGDLTCRVGVPAKTREAFLTGAWDTTSMLLDRFDEVRKTAARLPYLT